MAASNGLSDFEIMGTPRSNVNTPNKVTWPVTKEIQKLRLTKPATLKNSVKENSVKVTRQGWHTMKNPTHKVAWSFIHLVLLGHVRNWILYISIYRRPMYTKLGKLLAYCEMLPHLKSHDPLIKWPTWDHVTIWKVKTISQDLWLLELTRCWVTGECLAHKCFGRHRLLV